MTSAQFCNLSQVAAPILIVFMNVVLQLIDNINQEQAHMSSPGHSPTSLRNDRRSLMSFHKG